MQYTLKLHKYDIVEANVPSSGSVQDSKVQDHMYCK